MGISAPICVVKACRKRMTLLLRIYMASNMDEKKSGLLTRRQALLSIATITAGATIIAGAPRAVFGATPAKDKIKFIAIGDFGTGDDNQFGIAAQMLRAHQASPLDFVLAVGDNIYPDGGGRHFVKKFERPYAGLIRAGVPFHAVLGNHDVKDGRGDQCRYPLFNMNGRSYYTVKKGDGLVEFFMLDSNDFDMAQFGWLEGALKESTAKWKIAVFHHPIYSSAGEPGSNRSSRATESMSPSPDTTMFMSASNRCRASNILLPAPAGKCAPVTLT
jgi:hypothetical protein